MTHPSQAELARVVRDHAGRLAASLVSLVGDFAAAEDLVQDAVEAALTHWPGEGIPDRPDAWLYSVARRRGLDLLRRENRYRDKLRLLANPPEPEPDARLRLIFTCCHPALPRSGQVALTLRVVCGLTTAEIAKAFLLPESAVGQRITRAKRKISDAGIPYRIPAADELGARLAEVLAVIYLLFNEGYLSSGPGRAESRDLTGTATTCSTPPAPNFSANSATPARHERQTNARSPSRPTRPNSPCYGNASTGPDQKSRQPIARVVLFVRCDRTCSSG
jgi:RNA polymerase sigma factor (sigma-70 family)